MNCRRVGSALFFASLLATSTLGGCGDDGGDGGSTTTVGATQTNSESNTTPTTDAPSSSTAPTTETTAGSETTAASSSSTGTPQTSSSGETTTDPTLTTDTGSEESSTGTPNLCDPQIPGEFNACLGENGQIDNTLCNWMGVGGAVGFIGCLNSADMDGANVCIISDCVDDCDCFAAPATGTAPPVCRETLKGGGTACVLDCGAGQTCPDDMVCAGNICFHPPAA